MRDRTAVPQDVGQRFLHHAVCREVDPAGTSHRPVESASPRARLAASRPRGRDVGETRHRSHGRALVLLTQHPEQPAHLDQRLPARGLDHPQSISAA